MEKVTIDLTEYQGLLSRVQTLEEQVKALLGQNTALALRNEELLAQNQELVARMQVLEARNAELETRNTELEAKNKALEGKVLSLQQQLFGKKKDQIKSNKDSSLKDFDKVSEQEKKKVGRKARAEDYTPDESRIYDFETTPKCTGCQQDMRYIGSNDSHHEDYRVVFRKVRIRQAKYACRCCNRIIVANGSRLPIAKGLPLPGLLTQTILDKFSNASPAYRQAQNYGYMGISYSRQMLCNWFGRAADLVEPLVKLMFRKIIETGYIMADETPVTLLNIADKPSGSKGHICIIKQGGEGFNFVYCWVIESRTQKVITEKLEGFKGYVQTDGLNFYFEVQKKGGVISISCWSHARRKFVDIVKLSGKLEGIAFEVVKRIRELYRIEREGSKLNKENLLEKRQRESAAVLVELKSYLESKIIEVPPKSDIGKAIKYTLDRWEGLTGYIKDPNIAIDNNATERCIKYVVMGRKNWLFADNAESAGKLAMLYSLVISCKFNNINPREYLEYLFNQMPYINKHNASELEQMLPDRFNLSRRFDLEHLKKHGITQTIIEHQINGEENKLLAA